MSFTKMESFVNSLIPILYNLLLECKLVCAKKNKVWVEL